MIILENRLVKKEPLEMALKEDNLPAKSSKAVEDILVSNPYHPIPDLNFYFLSKKTYYRPDVEIVPKSLLPFGASGVYNPIDDIPRVSKDSPSSERISVSAHEVRHQYGSMNEETTDLQAAATTGNPNHIRIFYKQPPRTY